MAGVLVVLMFAILIAFVVVTFTCKGSNCRDNYDDEDFYNYN